jgi:hypothetical protein
MADNIKTDCTETDPGSVDYLGSMLCFCDIGAELPDFITAGKCLISSLIVDMRRRNTRTTGASSLQDLPAKMHQNSDSNGS